MSAPEGDLPPAPTVVVFDIGEVLIDETRVWSVWADLIGTSPLTFAAVLGAAVVQGEDHRAVFEHLAPNLDWRPLVATHEERYGGFREADLYADVRPCLAAISAQDRTVLLAGNQPARRTQQLEALGLPVDGIVTSEDLGAEKPDPAFFDGVLRLAGVTADQVLYVGDRVDNDVLAATAAGMRTCWLRRGPWGVLQDLPMDEDADLVLDGLGELPHLLETWATEHD